MINCQDTRYHELITSNISAQGVFFQTDARIPKGTQVRITLTILIPALQKATGSLGKVKIDGTVVRCDFEGIAVSFKKNYQIIRDIYHLV